MCAGLIPAVLLAVAGGQALRHVRVRHLYQGAPGSSDAAITFDPDLWVPYTPPPLVSEWSGVLYPALHVPPLRTEMVEGWAVTLVVCAVFLTALALALRSIVTRSGDLVQPEGPEDAGTTGPAGAIESADAAEAKRPATSPRPTAYLRLVLKGWYATLLAAVLPSTRGAWSPHRPDQLVHATLARPGGTPSRVRRPRARRPPAGAPVRARQGHDRTIEKSGRRQQSRRRQASRGRQASSGLQKSSGRQTRARSRRPMAHDRRGTQDRQGTQDQRGARDRRGTGARRTGAMTRASVRRGVHRHRRPEEEEGTEGGGRLRFVKSPTTWLLGILLAVVTVTFQDVLTAWRSFRWTGPDRLSPGRHRRRRGQGRQGHRVLRGARR
ncbi:hypothetical protein SCALM49S_03112 [Streptomyces californicus]